MDAFRSQLLSAIDALDTFLDSDHEDESSEQLKTQWVSYMQNICTTIRDAEQASLPRAQLEELVRKAEPALDKGIENCYGDDMDFNSAPSFAHSNGGFLKDSRTRIGSGILESFVTYMTKAGILRGPIPQDVLDLPKPWNDLTAPFPNSTPLARFYENLRGLSYTSTTPNAKSVLQASCEVTSDGIANPLGMAISSGGSILAMTGMSGWKERSPCLSYAWLAGDDQDHLTVRGTEVGLANVAYHIETDEQRKLVFIADEDRIKSYDWSSLETGNRDLLPKHTMRSQGFSGPLLMLPNGRLARAGKGKVAVWGLDGLQTHGPQGTNIIGRVEDDDEEGLWSRDDYEDIERSSGSRSNQVIQFAFDPTLKLNTWNLHPNNPSMVLCGQDSMSTRKYGMVMVDLEAGGKEVIRFLGHGATVTKITTGVGLEQGQGGHVFCTGCTDGMARIYDVRQRLPVLTVEGDSGEGACTALLAYPDGIPVLFTGAMSTTQCIRTWDVRAKATVYELSTGNNETNDLAWDGARNTLYASTSCPGMNRMGGTFDYRRARIPKVQLGRFGFPSRRDGCWDGDEGDYDPEDEDDDADMDDDGKSWVQEDDDGDAQYCWPKNAYNSENYFGHTFDAGDHTLFRYKFCQDANVDVTPPYGQATVERDDW